MRLLKAGGYITFCRAVIKAHTEYSIPGNNVNTLLQNFHQHQ